MVNLWVGTGAGMTGAGGAAATASFFSPRHGPFSREHEAMTTVARSAAETRAIGRMDFIAFDYASGPNCSHTPTRFDNCRQRALQQDRTIGQLVRVRAAAREVLLEQSAHATDAGDRALSEAAGAIMRLDFAAHLLPRRRRNALGDAPIREDLDVAVGEEHVDEHAVVGRRIPHAEVAEHFERPRAWRHFVPQLVDVERGLDDETDFARVPAF